MESKSGLDMVMDDHFGGWARFAAVRTPVIAAVSGYALGGGCELAMMCDIILAADTAKFGQPEINLGVIPGMGGSQRLVRAVGYYKAAELVLTGRMMDAEEAERAGLVSRVVPAADLLDEAGKVADTIASKSLPSRVRGQGRAGRRAGDHARRGAALREAHASRRCSTPRTRRKGWRPSVRSAPPTSRTADPPRPRLEDRETAYGATRLSALTSVSCAPIASLAGGGAGQSGSGSGRGSAKSPASLRKRAMIRTSSAVSSSARPGSAKTSVLSAAVARSTSSRPACRQHEHRGTSVARVRLALDQAVAHEPVDRVGDAGGVHLQPRDRAGHRHPSLAGEPEQAEHLVSGERQAERLEGRIDARQHQLLGADDRRHGRHAGSGIRPSVRRPLALRLGDRIDGKRSWSRHRRPPFPRCPR